MLRRNVLMSVAHEKIFYTCAMYESDFDQRWVCAGNIDVVLRFDFTTKLTRGGDPMLIGRGSFGQIVGVRHPIIDMFRSSTLVSRGGSFNPRQGGHQG
jgi:hypothetical protein